MNKPKIKIVVITGPTASGKTRLAVALAEKFKCEIISADSRQVYKGMDIGTGKDLQEYRSLRYHLIDIVSPQDEYNLAQFREDAPAAIVDIHKRGNIPLVCGGSAMYLDCLISEYSLPGRGQDSNARESLKNLHCSELASILGEKLSEDEAKNKNRLIRRIERKIDSVNKAADFPFVPEWLVIGVLRDRREIHRRIEERLKQRLADGMLEEVACLNRNGVSWERLEFFGLEYKYLSMHLQGKLSKEEMYSTLLAKIRNFARRQDVWFRKMEKKGMKIHWIRDGNIGIAEI